MAAPAPPQTPTQDPTFWDQLLDLASLKGIPTREQFVSGLMNLDLLQCLLLVAIGVVYLLCGWKAFKVLVVANAAMIGALIGAFLGGMLKGPNTQAMGAIAGALLLGALAWPLMKGAVAVMGGLAGSFIGYGVWKYIAGVSGSLTLGDYAWAGGLIGLVALALLAFVIFRETIITFTSLQGAVLAVAGVLAILLMFSGVREPLSRHLVSNLHLLPILIAVPAVIGLGCQHAALVKKKRRKRATAKPATA